jgi:hypothetical protein
VSVAAVRDGLLRYVLAEQGFALAGGGEGVKAPACGGHWAGSAWGRLGLVGPETRLEPAPNLLQRGGRNLLGDAIQTMMARVRKVLVPADGRERPPGPAPAITSAALMAGALEVLAFGVHASPATLRRPAANRTSKTTITRSGVYFAAGEQFNPTCHGV